MQCNLFLETSLFFTRRSGVQVERMETQMSGGEELHKTKHLPMVLMFLFTSIIKPLCARSHRELHSIFVLTRETTTTENMHIIELWMGFHTKGIIHRILHGLRVSGEEGKIAIAMHWNAFEAGFIVPTVFLRKSNFKTFSLSTEGEMNFSSSFLHRFCIISQRATRQIAI